MYMGQNIKLPKANQAIQSEMNKRLLWYAKIRTPVHYYTTLYVNTMEQKITRPRCQMPLYYAV